MLKAAIKVGPADHGRRMSLADFDHAEVQEGYLYELGRGAPNPLSARLPLGDRDFVYTEPLGELPLGERQGLPDAFDDRAGHAQMIVQRYPRNQSLWLRG